jgi:hypothetical protein
MRMSISKCFVATDAWKHHWSGYSDGRAREKKPPKWENETLVVERGEVAAEVNHLANEPINAPASDLRLAWP